ncbi:MAG: IS30 family transposase [Deltaproteobacteria bacterium]|nr:IS30 family transposase [Deltaproteobacteria bacterium]
MAKRLHRDPGTISRERFRNAAPVNRGYYLPHKADDRAPQRNRESHQRQRLKLPRIRRYVRDHVRRGWSPELIAGRWGKRHSDTPISHEAIYQWLYAEARERVPYLVRAHKKRKRRGYSRKHSQPPIPGRIDISQRPQHIAKRTIAGHWESDTAVSRQSKVVLQVSVERKPRFSVLTKLPRRQAKEMRMALNRKLCRVPQHRRKSITDDNGTENTAPQEVNAVLGTKSSFCTPFHSWERGTNENTKS